MVHKEEAQRIFNRFYDETLTHLSDHDTKEDARLSALICVDEIIKSRNWLIEMKMGVFEDLLKIKQEIKQL